MQHLVVGGTGFVGGHLVEHLVERGEHVRVLARRPDRPAWLPPAAELVQGDLNDPDHLPELIQGADVVYAVTRLPAPPLGETAALALLRRSLSGLVAACSHTHVARLVVVSGVDIYPPRLPQRPITEHFPGKPITVAGRLRLAAEQIVTRAAAAADLPLVIVRPVTVIGPRDHTFTCPLLDMYRYAPGPSLVGGGRARLSLVYVKDVARALAMVAQHPLAVDQVYHVSGVATSWRALVATVCAALEVPPPPPGLPQSLASALHWCLAHVAPPRRESSLTGQLTMLAGQTRLFSDDHLVRQVGYLPTYDLLAAVDETVAWYRGLTRHSFAVGRTPGTIAPASHGI